MSKDGAKPINSTKTAYFDIAEGVLYLNQDLVSKLKVQELTSTIAHELDHFDKIAKICKSIGTEKFFKLTEKNNFIITNKEFWIKASKKANLTNFDISLYENALERFINKNRLKTSSVYADINVISELLRNPLETSAYELSNYILDYFNINKKENETQKLANQFNETDWAIYNITSKDNSLRNERIALFDYLLMQTIVKNNSKYTSIVNKCKSTNGDLTPFWNEFKKDNNDFFDENIPTQKETYSYIINLLKEVETNAKSGLSSNNIAEAVKLYVYTLLTDIKYKDSVSRIKTSVEDYINYTKDNNIQNPKDLLKMYLILICLENNLNKDKTKEIPSLYYLKIPTLLLEVNESNKKNKRYNFIYKNSEFITELNKQKQIDTNTTEQKLLTEMIVKTASEIK